MALMLMRVSAVRADQALVAMTDNNSSKIAIRLWQQQAIAGNPTAQYNLAIAYKTGNGIHEDSSQAQRLLRLAANSKLVAAYHQLDTHTVRPALDTGYDRNLYIMGQILSRQDARYTIQLVSSTSKERIRKYFAEHNLDDRAGYFTYQKEGKDWYSIVYGTYTTVVEANEAIALMDENLRKWNPWVRNISTIKDLTMK